MKLALGMSLAAGNTWVFTLAQILVNAFKIRVIADGGVFEAKACLNTQLTTLNDIE